MRIIHCADLHLDSDMTSRFPKDVAAQRRRELLMTFRALAEYAKENSVSSVIIAGDLFDKKTVRRTALRFVLDTVKDHPTVDFYYLIGNHEAASLADGGDGIPENLKFFGKDWKTYNIGGGKRRVTLSGADFAPEESPVMSAELTLSPEDFNIVTLHGQITGYSSKDKGDTIDLGQYKNKYIDYLALGHIHSYGEGKLPPRGVWCYPGCLEGRGFDECGEHGFVLLDIDDESFEFRRTFVPFARRRIHLVKVPVGDCLHSSDAVSAVRSSLSDNVSENDIVRVVLTGEVDMEADIDTELIKKHFDDDFYLFDVVDSTSIKIDYSAFRLDESLKGEFVRLVESAADLDDVEKAKVIKCGIKALSGEDVGI